MSPPRIGSGQENTGFSTRSEAWPSAWLVEEPSKPHTGSSVPSGVPATILVFERSLAVGSVPSIQMYSALNVTEAILCGSCWWCGSRWGTVRGASAVGGSLTPRDFPSVARL